MTSECAPRVRHAIYKTFAEGGLPRAAAIAHQLRLSPDEVYQAMRDLHDAPAIVGRHRFHLTDDPFLQV